MSIIAALIIGGIAGWLAGLIVRGAGFGLIGNIVIGIIGALLASCPNSASASASAGFATSSTPPSAR